MVGTLRGRALHVTVHLLIPHHRREGSAVDGSDTDCVGPLTAKSSRIMHLPPAGEHKCPEVGFTVNINVTVVMSVLSVHEFTMQRDREWFGHASAPPRPDHREVDSEAMKRSRVVVDSHDNAMAKSGGVLLAIAEGAITEADVSTELGHVIVGPRTGRTSDDGVTLFESVGGGLQDTSPPLKSSSAAPKHSAWEPTST